MLLDFHLISFRMSENVNLQFSKLLQLLNSEIGSNGVSKSMQEDLKEENLKLHEVKLEYFRNQLIVGEVKNILADHHKQKKNNATSEEEEKVSLMLQDALGTSTARQHLRLSRKSEEPDCNLFGLQEDKLTLKHGRKKDIQMIFQQYYTSEIEQRLKQQCINLIRFWDSRSEEESDGLALAKATKLPTLVKKEIEKISNEEEMLQNEKLINQKLLIQNFQVVCSSLETLEQSVEKHSVNAKMENAKVTVNWLAVKCEAVQRKIRVLQCQLLKDTYNQESVAALQNVRHLLDTALNESKTELTKLRYTLQIYESVGPGFESLVKQYVQLTAEIDNKRWALSELKRTQSLDNTR